MVGVAEGVVADVYVGVDVVVGMVFDTPVVAVGEAASPVCVEAAIAVCAEAAFAVLAMTVSRGSMVGMAAGAASGKSQARMKLIASTNISG